jgi:hydrogenase maturation protease
MIGSERPLVLVIGIGNRDRGDDGIGPAVSRRLKGRVPSGVAVLERSGDALALIEDWNGVPVVILVDAVTLLTEPGRIHRLQLTNSPILVAFAPRSTHAFGLAETVEVARSLQRLPRCLIAYFVEGEQFAVGAPLSATVATAVGEAAERILMEISAQMQTCRAHA